MASILYRLTAKKEWKCAEATEVFDFDEIKKHISSKKVLGIEEPKSADCLYIGKDVLYFLEMKDFDEFINDYPTLDANDFDNKFTFKNEGKVSDSFLVLLLTLGLYSADITLYKKLLKRGKSSPDIKFFFVLNTTSENFTSYETFLDAMTERINAKKYGFIRFEGIIRTEDLLKRLA